jgi:hypothetical protein
MLISKHRDSYVENLDCRLLKNLLNADRADKYPNGGVLRPFVWSEAIERSQVQVFSAACSLGYRMRQRKDKNLIRATAPERSAAFVHRRA